MILYDIVRRSNEILCLMISNDDTVQQQWDSLSHYFILWYSAAAMKSSVSWLHMMKMCTSNDGLCVSHNLTLWQSIAGMRFFVSWFDMMTQCSSNEILSHDLIWHNAATMRSVVSWSHMMTMQQQLHLVFPMISHDDSAATITLCVPHDLKQWQYSNNYTLCSPWSHTMKECLKHAVSVSKERRL